MIESHRVNSGERHDERNSLEMVLETTKHVIGQDRKIACDNLIKELREHLEKTSCIENNL